MTNININPNLPLVSVLLPIYNGGIFLKDSIESILNQTYENIEIIVINDNSSDNSEEVIQSFKETNIKYHRNKENLGLIDTLNLGVSLSSGKYIVRIDQDDIALPERIEKQVIYLENNADCIVCGSYIQLIKNNVLTNEIVKYYTNNDDIKFSLLFYAPFAHPAVTIRSNVFLKNKVKYNKDYTHAEDYQLWTILSDYGMFHTIPEVLTHYRIHDNQTSFLYKENQENQIEIIRNEYFEKNLLLYTNIEKEIILNNSNDYDPELIFRTLKKFMDSDIIRGEAKIRYINKRIKNAFTETNSIQFNLFISLFFSRFYWKNNFTIKQTFVLFYKSIKSVNT